ncbi:MAG TPA: cytochrome c3 family protein [Thermodesulfovibrionales bacterium]|jgi:c(7)-type cytochrome triheme protein|nr:cytochrome c3 family protein [Thermodesulfovibrionales bacterium]
MRWILFISLFTLIVSCAPHVEKQKVEKPPERIVTRDEAANALPCFRCHSFPKFSSMEKGSGVFPHGIHRDTGYHCNQCHPFKGHSPIRINTTLCADCHDLKTFTLASSGFPVKFNHEFHTKLGCKECHLGIFLMKRGSTRITMDDIYQGKYCGECHNGKRAFPPTECSRCHDLRNFDRSLLYKVEGIGNVLFSHKFHLSMFKCDDCHTKLFAMKKTQGKMTMSEMNNGKFCGACHNGTAATSVTECEKCHKP